MKRVLLAVTGTVAGVAALLTFKTHSPVAASGSALPSAGLPATSTAPPAVAANTATASGSPPGPPAATPSGAAGRPSSSAPVSSAAPASATYTGVAEQTRYGVVQIKITTSGKKITDVAFVQLTAFDGRSQQINSFAAPQLLQETIAAQSANIDGVSGASYTSQGYVQSLQSALDEAGI